MSAPLTAQGFFEEFDKFRQYLAAQKERDAAMDEGEQAHANMRKFLGEAVTEVLSWPHADRVAVELRDGDGYIAIYRDDGYRSDTWFSATLVDDMVSTAPLLVTLRHDYDTEMGA